MPSQCHFCEQLTRLQELPDDQLVWQFPHSIALLGPWQYYTGYCILVSRRHATELHQLDPAERQAFLQEMVTLSEAIATTFQPRKMNCELLGNQVPHLHWHLFPRGTDDPDTLKPVWLALDRTERDPGEKARLQTAACSRVEIAARLRHTLGQLHASTL
jgi:diadenosine tetraphosphate (Ap4A) HIT family hydrolase